MREAKRKIFADFAEERENALRCVTTNGRWKRDGSAIMGAGVALACAKMYPEIPHRLGIRLQRTGNRVYLFLPMHVATFPTMHEPGKVNGELMMQSFHQLKELADSVDYPTIYLPRPGCGMGGLRWEEDGVKDMCEKYLDDRFVICHI